MLRIKKKTFILLISYLAAAVLCLGGYAAAQTVVGGNYGSTARDGYRHAFDETQTAVADLDQALRKGAYASGAAMSSAVCTEIYGDCLAAQMTMSVLPFSTQELEQTSAFVNRTGDYACYLGRNSARNGGLTDEERGELSKLSAAASQLSAGLTKLRGDIEAGSVVMDDPENVIRARTEAYKNAATLSAALLKGESAFPEQDELSYDGQYSYQRAEDYTGDILTQSQAREKAAAFLGLDAGRLTAQTVSGGRRLGYYFSVALPEGDGSITVDGRTGLVRTFAYSRALPQGGTTEQAAAEAAEQFIEKNGFGGVTLIKCQKAAGMISCAFAPVSGGAKCYTDMIKISVAADNCGVCSFDAGDYIENHRDRQAPAGMVSESAARQALPGTLTVKESGLAVIASPGGSDVYCREFKCVGTDGGAVTVFVNALTGAQQEIELG